MLEIEKFIWSKLKQKQEPIYEDWHDELLFTYEEYKERLDKINKYRDTLKFLRKNRGIKQRTDKWYNARLDMLTASDTYSGIKEHKSLIRKKALKDNTSFTSNALYWGVAFEPVASKIYSFLNNRVKLYEFGLIKYDEYDHYGASPDGISELGIMLEIKCPISREIKKGNIPIKYYAQMQGQMAVCHLDECDYAEFSFEEIDAKSFIELNEKETFCGMIVEKEDGTFEYSRLRENPNLCYFQHINTPHKKIIYWKLKEYNIERVYLDKDLWYNDYLPKIKEFWNKVSSYEGEPKYSYIEDDD
tara:strand:+ start:472 stop:1377 length:906 start_codon:yes stop_codon:yes gene_type:complete